MCLIIPLQQFFRRLRFQLFYDGNRMEMRSIQIPVHIHLAPMSVRRFQDPFRSLGLLLCRSFLIQKLCRPIFYRMIAEFT
jgi:hypothetical protein